MLISRLHARSFSGAVSYRPTQTETANFEHDLLLISLGIEIASSVMLERDVPGSHRQDPCPDFHHGTAVISTVDHRNWRLGHHFHATFRKLLCWIGKLRKI